MFFQRNGGTSAIAIDGYARAMAWKSPAPLSLPQRASNAKTAPSTEFSRSELREAQVARQMSGVMERPWGKSKLSARTAPRTLGAAAD